MMNNYESILTAWAKNSSFSLDYDGIQSMYKVLVNYVKDLSAELTWESCPPITVFRDGSITSFPVHDVMVLKKK